MVEMLSAKAFETELNSITQAISLSDFIQQHVRKHFKNCRMCCIFSYNSLRHLAILSFDSDGNNVKHYDVWPMNPIEISDYNSDYNNDYKSDLTIYVYEDGLIQPPEP